MCLCWLGTNAPNRQYKSCGPGFSEAPKTFVATRKTCATSTPGSFALNRRKTFVKVSYADRESSCLARRMNTRIVSDVEPGFVESFLCSISDRSPEGSTGTSRALACPGVSSRAAAPAVCVPNADQSAPFARRGKPAILAVPFFTFASLGAPALCTAFALPNANAAASRPVAVVPPPVPSRAGYAGGASRGSATLRNCLGIAPETPTTLSAQPRF
mmetsp:Transcript_9737/g.36128  ORF Transcript_9737/g.36128 Transcript_9737/m.36128 type:complete len:215 (-) Transcript_9737:2937-3581(-)